MKIIELRIDRTKIATALTGFGSIDRSVARLNNFFNASIESSLKQGVRDIARVFDIELCSLNVAVEITTSNNFNNSSSVNLGPRKFRIHIEFEAVKPLPRKDKVMLLRSAIRHSSILSSIDSQMNAEVLYVLDQCPVSENSIKT